MANSDAEPDVLASIEERGLPLSSAPRAIPPVDAAAISYLLSSHLRRWSATPADVNRWMGCAPHVTEVIETHLGRIAVVTLPVSSRELYSRQADLIRITLDALRELSALGAQFVTLTGLLGSATGYGQAILDAGGDSDGLPRISTGHATTAAAVCLSIASVALLARRSLSDQVVGVLGIGSIGTSVLRALVACLPHPAELVLSDLFHRRNEAVALERELRERLGYGGRIRFLQGGPHVPDEFYESRFVVAATNVHDILDVDRLRAGTIVVDDSVPNCFSHERARRRVEQRGDVLILNGGQLRSPRPMRRTQYLVPGLRKQMLEWELAAPDPYMITSCVLSGLLSSRRGQVPPTVGMASMDSLLANFGTLLQLEYAAPRPQFSGHTVSDLAIGRFTSQFG